eukprot:6236273-Amphidinium_carterae.1
MAGSVPFLHRSCYAQVGNKLTPWRRLLRPTCVACEEESQRATKGGACSHLSQGHHTEELEWSSYNTHDRQERSAGPSDSLDSSLRGNPRMYEVKD